MTVSNNLYFAPEASHELHAAEHLLASSVSKQQEKSGIIRYIERLFTNYTHNTKENHVETRIFSGEGSHTVEVYVGGQKRELIIDTGSGRTAFLCDQCDACGQHHKNPPYHPNRSTRHGHFVRCDPVTNFFDVWNYCDECVDKKCKYGQLYVEGDMWEAYKVEDYLSFGTAKDFGANIEFGCIFHQSGIFVQQSADGIMGLSIHQDSILEQLYREKAINHRVFSQCLASDGGILVMGGLDDSMNQLKIMYTPLEKRSSQYWVVNLQSVEIDSIPLHVESSEYNQGRGCVFDSGTTFVYLPVKVKAAFLQTWEKATHGKVAPPLFRTVMHFSTSQQELETLPEICFHLEDGVKICMKASQYYIAAGSNRYEGTISFNAQVRATILGASLLINHNIVYDLENRRIGIVPANCSRISVSKPSMIKMASESSATLRTIASRITSSEIFIKFDQMILALLCFFILLAISHKVVKKYDLRSSRQEEKKTEQFYHGETYDGIFDTDADAAFVLLKDAKNE